MSKVVKRILVPASLLAAGYATVNGGVVHASYVKGDGSDLRQTDVTKDGNTQIAFVALNYKDGSRSHGTATFIGNRTLVTSAHLFAEPGKGGHAEDQMVNDLASIDVIINHNSQTANGKPTSGRRIHIDNGGLRQMVKFYNGDAFVKKYGSSARFDANTFVPYDLATITIPTPLAFLTTAEGLGTRDPLSIAQYTPKYRESIHLAGYPGDEPDARGKMGTPIVPGKLYDVSSPTEGLVDYDYGTFYTYGLYNPDSMVSKRQLTAKDIQDGYKDFGPLDTKVLTYNGTGIGGMSGSSVLNDKGQIIGTYTGSVNFPESRTSRKGVGLVPLFNEARLNWLKVTDFSVGYRSNNSRARHNCF